MTKKTIMIIDDTPAVLVLLNDLLRPLYKIKVASKAFQGIKAALAEPQPDLILLDVMMPDINGFDVCKMLKENPRTATIPILFLSSLDKDEEVAFGLALGAVGFIKKPVLPAELHRIVASCFTQ